MVRPSLHSLFFHGGAEASVGALLGDGGGEDVAIMRGAVEALGVKASATPSIRAKGAVALDTQLRIDDGKIPQAIRVSPQRLVH